MPSPSSRLALPFGAAARRLDRARLRRSRLGRTGRRPVRAGPARAARRANAARARGTSARGRQPLLLRGTLLRRRRRAGPRARAAAGLQRRVRRLPRRARGRAPGDRRRTGRPPTGPHGPEVERVYIPVRRLRSRRGADGNALAVASTPRRCAARCRPSAPAVAVDVGAARGVRIVRGPYLTCAPTARTAAGMTVNWQTDLPAAATARSIAATRRGAEQARARFAGDADGTPDRRRPRARRVVPLPAASSTPAAAIAPPPGRSVFKTLPAARRAGALRRLRRHALSRPRGAPGHRRGAGARGAALIVINTGDLTDLGSEESNWQKYFEITAPAGGDRAGGPRAGQSRRRAARDRRGASPGRCSASLPRGRTWLDVARSGRRPLHHAVDQRDAQHGAARPGCATIWRGRAATTRGPSSRSATRGPGRTALHGGADRDGARSTRRCWRRRTSTCSSPATTTSTSAGSGPRPEGKLTYVVTGGGGAPLYNPSCRAASGPPPVVPRPLPPCPASVAVLTNGYHYITVEVAADGRHALPASPRRHPVEACVHLPPHGRRSRAQLGELGDRAATAQVGIGRSWPVTHR